MSTTTPVDLQLQAYNAHEIEGFCAAYHDDVIMAELSGAPIFSGLSAVRAHYTALFHGAPELSATLTSRQVHHNHVVDHELIRGRPGKPDKLALVIYAVEGAKIHRVWFVPD